MFSASRTQREEGTERSNSNQKRIEQLSKVLSNIQPEKKVLEERDLQAQAQTKREFYFQRMKQIEEKLQKSQSQDIQRFKILDEQINKEEEVLKQECEQRDLIAEKSIKSIALAEKTFTLMLNEEYQFRKQHEAQFLADIDDKIQGMKQNFIQDSYDIRQQEKKSIQTIEQELDELHQIFMREKQIRDQDAELIIKNLGDKIFQLQEFMNEEKRLSEDSYDMTIKLLNDLDMSIQNDLENEVKIRENSEKSMLKLLEQTCQKVEQTLLSD